MAEDTPPAPNAATPAPRLVRQGTPKACYGCGQGDTALVYLQNGRDYCVACAQMIFVVLGLRPAGRRWTDLTLDDITRHSTASGQTSVA